MASKKQRVHMDLIDCTSYSCSEEGSIALTNPNFVCKTSKDPNRGLYPKPSRKNSTRTFKLQSHNLQDTEDTKNFNQSTSNFMTGREYYAQIGFKMNSTRKKRSLKSSPQKNTLLTYFQPLKKAQLDSISSKKINDSDSDDFFCEIDNNNEKSQPEEMYSDDLWDNFSKTENNCDSVICTDDEFSDIYGMLGSGNLCEQTETEYFELLPVHIFELILCQLPFTDLMLNYKKVSKYWNEVISNNKFIPWKKKYYQIKSGKCEDAQIEIERLCKKSGMDNIFNCLPYLIKFMKNFNHIPSADMLDNLKKHIKYQWAEDLITERFPECINNEIPNPWSVVAALIIISKTVWDVYSILQLLLHSKSQCPVPDVLECMYCIATFLFHFKQTYKINYGFHYRVFYTLYIYENQCKSKKEDITALNYQSFGQQSIMKYSFSRDVRFTHEQMRIINHELQKNQIVKIVAFAGTGKTSTLIEYTRLRPHLKFLNVMYNKSVCDHAKKCFPCNVECRTAHSLAWSAVGKRYVHKLSSKIKPIDIISLLKTKPISINKYQYAHIVLTTIETFMNSADMLITTAHVPGHFRQNEISANLSSQDILNAADDAEYLWNQMKDRNSPVHIVHDAYLKLYQLSHPDLSYYDCILIDEAQDCNGAMLDFLLSQPCPKILVGDPNQQIYAFRGATNALDGVISTHTYYLTQSFRFGPEIAYIASCILEVSKKISNKTLVGGTQSGCVTGKTLGQLCIIARSNLTLLNEAIRLCCRQEFRSNDPRNIFGHLNGGIKAYNLDQIVDIYYLLTNGSDSNLIKDKFIKRFKDFLSLTQYAKAANDTELTGKIHLVLQHTADIPAYIQKIKEKCSYSLDMANIIFTTGHKSKGLEFDSVRILDDFLNEFEFLQENQLETAADFEAEYNLLYVAITRAKKCLLLSISLYHILLHAQEKFEYFASRRDFKYNEKPKCFFCGLFFTTKENPLVLMRDELTLSNSGVVVGGPICSRCATNPTFIPVLPYFGPLNLDFQARTRRPIRDYSHQSIKTFVGNEINLRDTETEGERLIFDVPDNII